MADEQQEQPHETVTTTITQRNLYKLLNVGELIFEIDWRSDAPRANWTETYIAQLHQISYQYSTMHIYPAQMYPPLIKLRAREPDYTKFTEYSTMHIYPGQMYPLLIELRPWLHQISYLI